ncbi:protein kinase [Acetobacterium fimetarium]|uniref:Protein kinase n=2 Tax=Acetobacterium fimetarium TaxID=52691 RepID=A0ABR6WTL4_9FIRM|nr:protein kinase [Acetobacterium fimetarium]
MRQGDDNSLAAEMKREKIAEIEEKVKSEFENKYQVLKRLGCGGMGCVFHVQSTDESGGDYALKVLDKEAYRKNRLLYKQEANVMLNLDHPGIPKMIDVTEDDDYLYMVQEFITGKPLSQIIREKGRLEAGKISDFMKSVASTLSYLHHQGLIHRDIKPDNMILTADGGITIIDFGLARKKEQIDEADKRVYGTLSYTAPERFNRKPGTVQTDIYGYGAAMYQLCTGKKPENMKTEPWHSYQVMSEHLSETMPSVAGEIIKKALAVNPRHRYLSFDAILWDLSHENKMRTIKDEELIRQAIEVFLIFSTLLFIGLISL